MVKFMTGSETTRPERLLDAIIIRSAFDTPLLARLPHETTTHIEPNWPMDRPFSSSDGVRNLATPHASTKLEGANYSFRTPSYQVRAKTVCEIQHHGFEMTGSDRAAVIAGQTNPWDYQTGRLAVMHANSIDNTLMYGLGSPETNGSVQARKTQGLISSAAWTGQERMHSTAGASSIQDVYGTTIPSDMWSVFYNANHDPLTLDSFYTNMITPLAVAGADLDTASWLCEVGYRLMQRVARFLIADGGVVLNERNTDASSAMGSDYVNVFKLASGHTVMFRVNRWLNDGANTFTINNQTFTGYSPSTPTTPGHVSVVYQGDQTLIAHEPGTAKVLWYREPGFENIATAGDFSQIAIKSEFALQVDHPLCVAGIGNALA